ncbi:MAG: hypothetical protein AB7K52_10985 [Phycisphaerales bacterium]
MAKGLQSLSITDLEREIARRRSGVSSLLKRRKALERRLAALDAKIHAAGGSAGGAVRGRRGPRPKNSANLVDSLRKLLNGKTLSVTDAADAVRRAGYRTNSPNFRTMVNAALLKKKFFKRTGRGMYTAC